MCNTVHVHCFVFSVLQSNHWTESISNKTTAWFQHIFMWKGLELPGNLFMPTLCGNVCSVFLLENWEQLARFCLFRKHRKGHVEGGEEVIGWLCGLVKRPCTYLENYHSKLSKLCFFNRMSKNPRCELKILDNLCSVSLIQSNPS